MIKISCAGFTLTCFIFTVYCHLLITKTLRYVNSEVICSFVGNTQRTKWVVLAKTPKKLVFVFLCFHLCSSVSSANISSTGEGPINRDIKFKSHFLCHKGSCLQKILPSLHME